MVPRGLIGVVHLPPMPGDPAYDGPGGHLGFGEVEARALADAEALAEGGVDALIIENFGSAPFARGDAQSRLPAHQVALIALVARAARVHLGLRVGINCLRNDAESALGIAAAVGASFVRINVHTGAMLTDQGLIQGEAHHTLRYRKALGCARDVAILADVLVKHATPLAAVDPADATRDTVLRGHADAVIVTGNATGGVIDVALLEQISGAAGEAPVVLGSGVTPENAAKLAPLADAAIVGTWLKRDGKLANPVDTARVRRMKDALGAHLRSRAA